MSAQDVGQVLLRRYLDASSDSEMELHLGRLLNDYAKPLIRRIVGSKLRGVTTPADAEDLVSETVMQLLKRLRDLKREERPAEAIQDVRGYIATAAYHSCDERLRNTHPERVRLSNHLRYLFRHRHELAMWTGRSGQLLCGFRRWQDSPSSETPKTLRHDDRIETIVASLLDREGAPIEFETLVDAVAFTTGTNRGLAEVPLGPAEANLPRIAAEEILEQRFSLRELWHELRQLPPKQRTALILNLRDTSGREVVSLLPLTRTATIAEIAQVVSIPIDDFARIWNDLPLDDRRIAAILGVTREQVIKLRRLARERLWRRRKRTEKNI